MPELKLDQDLVALLAPARQRFVEKHDDVVKDLDRGTAHPMWTDQGHLRQMPMSMDEERHTATFTITTPTVDSYGDVVVPQGCDFKRHDKNPVVQYGHDYFAMPIGRCDRHEVVKDEAVYADCTFAVGLAAGTGYEDWPLLLWNYVAKDFIRATSIGFMPRVWEKRYVTDTDGEKLWKGGYVFMEWELLEFSIVSVPSNEDALVLAVGGALHFADRLGMKTLSARLGLDKIAAAQKLVETYPELTQDNGMRALLERHLESYMAERKVRFVTNEFMDTLTRTAATDGADSQELREQIRKEVARERELEMVLGRLSDLDAALKAR